MNVNDVVNAVRGISRYHSRNGAVLRESAIPKLHVDQRPREVMGNLNMAAERRA
jgi:hypothetical protein